MSHLHVYVIYQLFLYISLELHPLHSVPILLLFPCRNNGEEKCYILNKKFVMVLNTTFSFLVFQLYRGSQFYYPLANEIAKGYSNATVRSSVTPL